MTKIYISNIVKTAYFKNSTKRNLKKQSIKHYLINKKFYLTTFIWKKSQNKEISLKL